MKLNLIEPLSKCFHLSRNPSLDSCVNYQGYEFLQVIDIDLKVITKFEEK
jgi:hypothetical protein